MTRMVPRLIVLAVLAALLTGCSEDPPRAAGTPSPSPSAAPSASPSAPASTGVIAASVPALAVQEHTGDRLRLGRVRERTAAYTSYDVTFRSRSTTANGIDSYRISGVLNVPRGAGPFPAVVLAHGYIDPEVYVRGQGMTRERGYLAERGFVAFHVDYRNHAESDDDTTPQAGLRLGYSADIINAVKALRASTVPVDDDRIHYLGRSMGGGVVLKALIAEPGLVRSAGIWASVSSSEAENYRQFLRKRPEAEVQRPVASILRENSSRPYFEEITEPVLMVHGRYDDTCPPRWATATKKALDAAGVRAELAWYQDGHAFGPQFGAAMDRVIRYFETA